MLKFFMVLTLIVVNGTSFSQTAFRIEALDLLKQGDIELQKGNWDEALKLYGLSIETDIAFAQAYYHRARLNESLNRGTDAQKDYKTARQLNPYIDYFFNYQQRNNLIALEYTGSTELIARDPSLFIDLFVNEDLYSNSNQLDTLIWNGIVQLKSHNNIGAQESLDQYIEKNEKDSRSYDLQGIIFLSEYNILEARNCFDQAIALDSLYLPSYYNRAIVLRYLDQNLEAINDLNFVIKSTDSYMSYYLRALILKESGKLDDALADYNLSLNLKDDFEPAILNRIYLNKKLGNFISAYNDAKILVERSPDNSEFHNTMGIMEILIGDEYSAIKSFTNAIELNHDRPKYYYNRGITYILISAPLLACPDIEISLGLGQTDNFQIMESNCGF